MTRLLIALLLCIPAFSQRSTFIALLGSGAAPSGLTCGNTTVEATGEPGWTNQILSGAKCTPGANSSVVDCKVYFAGTTGNLNCGVYDSDGTGGRPHTKICAGTPITPSAGWNTVTLSGCGTLTMGHVYWVTVIVDTGANLYHGAAGSSGDSYYETQTCCAMSDFATGTPYNFTYSMYLDLM